MAFKTIETYALPFCASAPFGCFGQLAPALALVCLDRLDSRPPCHQLSGDSALPAVVTGGYGTPAPIFGGPLAVKFILTMSLSFLSYTTLSKLIDFFPFPKKPREISPSRIILPRSGTKKLVRDLSPDLPRARVRDLSLVFFVPDLRRIIRQGEISRFFF